VLVDILENKVGAEFLDLAHAVKRLNNGVKVINGGYEDVRGADIICICAGRSILPGETRKDLGGENFAVMQEIVGNATKIGFDGIYLIATNPLDVMVQSVLKLSGHPAHHVIGTGTCIDTARLHFVMEEENIPCNEETCMVLGEHGNSMMVPWGLDKNLSALTDDKKEDILKRVRTAGIEVLRGKGYTNYAIGTCLYDIIKKLLRGDEFKYIVSFYDKAQGVCYGRPAIINKDGIVREVPLELNKQDKATLQKSIDEIKACIAEIEGLN
jgi:L-lactate dehydrogenase